MPVSECQSFCQWAHELIQFCFVFFRLQECLRHAKESARQFDIYFSCLVGVNGSAAEKKNCLCRFLQLSSFIPPLQLSLVFCGTEIQQRNFPSMIQTSIRRLMIILVLSMIVLTSRQSCDFLYVCLSVCLPTCFFFPGLIMTLQREETDVVTPAPQNRM